jgi:hypothetical protein
VKVTLAINGLHGIVSQKIELFKTTENKNVDAFEVLKEVNMKSSIFWNVTSFLRNVNKLIPDYTASLSRRYYSSALRIN